MNLAYADRDTDYADPAFVVVPAEGLLSKQYAAQCAKQMTRDMHPRPSKRETRSNGVPCRCDPARGTDRLALSGSLLDPVNRLLTLSATAQSR